MEATTAILRERPRAVAFAGVFVSVLCCFMAIGAVLPILPRYVHGPLGSGDVAVGVVVGAFAFTAVIGRPIGGRLADSHGRRIIVIGGMLLSALGGALYLLPFGVPGLILARLVLGAGDGWVFTAGATWVVDLAPESRRGQAIGLFGLAIWGGLAVGPVLGEALLSAGGYDLVWAFAAASPLVGAVLARRVPDPHVPIVRPPEAQRRALVPREVRVPGAALALGNIGYGTVAGFLVLHLADQGIGHGASAFAAFAGAVVLARLALGRLPDRLGPQITAAGALIAETIGLVLIAAAQSWWMAGLGAVIMGGGFSLLFPSLALIVMDRTDDAARGTVMGALTAFFDVGVGLGAPLAGAVAALSGYPGAFYAAAGCAAAGALLTFSRPGPHAHHDAPATPA
ncbi:MAG: transporter [Solirubrobacterales bacterium]|nr:transporter [Solirubrobacterales bacterium]